MLESRFVIFATALLSCLTAALPAQTQLQTTKTLITFPDAGNTTNPFAPQFFVLTAPSTTSFTLAVSPQSSWLQAAPAPGNGLTTPSTIQVSVNTSGLTNNQTYEGTITAITPTQGQITVTVRLTLGAGSGTGGLVVSPLNLTFNHQTGSSTLPAPQQFTITAPSPTTYNLLVQSTGGWLSANPLSGVLSNTANIAVSVNPTALSQGTYFGTIRVTVPSQADQIVNVTLNVTGSITSGLVTVTPSQFNFTWENGAANPPPQTLTINTTVANNYEVTPISAGNWLRAVPVVGSTNPTALVAVSVEPQGLLPGTQAYNGTLRVTVQGQFIDIPVSLTVTAGSGPSGLLVSPASMTFNYQIGASQPSPQALTITTPTPAQFGVSITTDQGFGWLVASVPGGTTQGSPAQAQITIGVNTGGLSNGIYTGKVTISATGLANQVVNVILNIGNTPTGSLSPNQLNFTYQTGGGSPPSQILKISTLNGLQTTFSASATTVTGGSWLQVTPSGGAAPGFVVVNVNPAGLSVGTYQGTVTVTLGGSPTPISVPVALNVNSLPVLRFSLNSATFNYQIGGTVPAGQGQAVEVTSTGAALTFVTTTQVNNPPGGTWLSVSVPSGTTPSTIQININAAGLVEGTYTGNVSLAATGQAPVVIPVTLNVSNSQLINVDPIVMNFTSAAGSQAPASQTLHVTSTSSTGAGAGFTPTVTVATGLSWLSISPNTASSTPADIQVNVKPTGLAQGTYFGSIVLNGSVAGSVPNSPVIVPVIYTVGGGANLGVSPSSMQFTQLVNGAPPAAKQLSVTSTATLLSFSASTTVQSSVNWLSVSPATGITPGAVQVSVNAGSLPAGEYTGAVIITSQGAGNSPQVVPVTLSVVAQPTLTFSPASLTFNASTAAPQPASMQVQVQSGGTNVAFTAAAFTSSGGTNWLTVTPTSADTPATLTVSVNASGLQPGIYNGRITINPGLIVAPYEIPVTLNVTQLAPPVINAVTSAASLQPTSISPGMIVAIFGSNLGPANLVNLTITQQGTVATTLADVRALFDGIPAPLIYVRQDVVAAVVPYALAGRASARLVVEHQGARSNELIVSVVTAQPAIFTTNQQGTGQGAIQNTDFSLNGSGNPVSRGGNNFATMYITGEGQLTPAGIDGVIATTNPLRRVFRTVQVRIGNVEAPVIFAGAVPTVVLGLAQVSFFIPENAPTGSAVPVEVIIDGQRSPGGVTMAIR